MTKVVRIEPTGELIHCDGAALELAVVAFDGTVDVVRCFSPILNQNSVFVGVIDDWGIAKGCAVNWKAWALYGRSPIFGAMYFADDAGHELPKALLDMIAEPLEAWVDPQVIDTMNEILVTNYPEAIR